MKAIATANYDFEKLITEGCVYVDKTDMLGKLASAKDVIYFISRPRHGWEFMRADGSASETNSAAWRAVRAPHDWGVEKSFDPKKPYGDAYLEPTGDEGELFLNGRSLGRRKKDPKNWKKAYRLTWDGVVYEPGTLKVVTYKNGAPWAEKTITTTGPAAQLKLEVEDNAEAGADLVFVNLEVQDAEGRFVPDAAVDVTFTVKGPCELVATDNGDEADFASFHSPTRRTFSGRLQAIVRKNPNASEAIALTASSPGFTSVTTTLPR